MHWTQRARNRYQTPAERHRLASFLSRSENRRRMRHFAKAAKRMQKLYPPNAAIPVSEPAKTVTLWDMLIKPDVSARPSDG